MTNNWTDMANSTCVVIMGANPSENHPASFAHINKAREGVNGHPKAKLIVIDPRKTRSALQCDVSKGDRYIRIRPGTDIAFVNGVINQIINSISGQAKTNWETYLNQVGALAFVADGNNGTTSVNRSKYTDARMIVDASGKDYKRSDFTNTDSKTIKAFPEIANSYNEPGVDTVFNKLAEHVAPYTTAVVANICKCSEDDIVYVANSFIENSRCSSYDPAAPAAEIKDPTSPFYRATTMLYAMGITQHTYGSGNVKSFATIQTLMGNMGRAGGGINALRGIHNVQGSTDMGLLYGNIPAYSGNPTVMPFDASGNPTQGFGKYMDKLWAGLPNTGTGRVSGPTWDASGNGTYDDAYDDSKLGFQQAGYLAMVRKWFGDTTISGRANIDKLYALWPKGNGDNHIAMFRKMSAGTTRALVCWGQNPAVTEPNQGAVRAGLENLDLLVVTDMYETETAACKRKASGVTYLLPACSHVEEAGSVTNSGRVLQWRERATLPKGNSKADIDLLFRFAYALDQAGSFDHISAVWDTIAGFTYTSVYDKLYGDQHAGGWSPADGTSFETISMADVESWPALADAPVVGTATGSEAVCESIYREMCRQVNQNNTAPNSYGLRGTMWIYTEAYSTGYTGRSSLGDWLVHNRAKSRDTRDVVSATTTRPLNLYPNWGYAWLVNRRVLYTNGDFVGDQTDGYQGPDKCSRLFVSTNTGTIDYSNSYRSIHQMADKPDVANANHVLPGRFPAHTEPYETPRADLAATWGRNTKGGAAFELVPADTKVVGRDSFTGTPVAGKSLSNALVLTTIRCVEHFQGGPTTRNNAWNVEAEPEPWIEINSTDARRFGIITGDLVNVKTIRGDSKAGQQAITNGAVGFAKGFRARVGVGIESNQRVGQGVVAIPWHWGDRGLSTGSRANDLCIDAMDANTTIPEYKACLCWIEKA